jgi:glucosamine--fructose-6-phosphate aminotransferase (isomerizing)
VSITKKEVFEESNNIQKIYQLRNEILSLFRGIDFSKYDEILFVGCGSSYHLAKAAERFFVRTLKKPSKAIVGSEVLYSSDAVLIEGRKYLSFVLSRSGESTETVKAAEVLKKKYNSYIIGVSCEKDSSLLKLSDSKIHIPLNEEAVVMTGSFSSTLMILNALALEVSGESSEVIKEIVEKAQDILEQSKELFEKLRLTDYNNYVFLGFGEYYGIAKESSLKLQEMTISHTEAFPTLDYRHGPKSLVDEKSLITINLTKEGYEEEMKLVKELEGYGGTVITIGEKEGSKYHISLGYEMPFDGMDSFIRVLPIHIMGLKLAELKGVDVDKPRNLSKVVIID